METDPPHSSYGDLPTPTKARKKRRRSDSDLSTAHSSESNNGGEESLNDRSYLEVDQKVFAREKGQIYEATIKKINAKVTLYDDEKNYMEYLVHFKGWSQRHNKWMRESNILPNTEENSRLAAESKQKMNDELNDRKEKKLKKLQAEKEKKERKKRKPKRKEEPQEVFTMEQNCELPFTLKTILVDDRSKVTRLGRYVAEGYDPDQLLCSNWVPPRLVHILPATVTVEMILRAFAKFKIKAIRKKKENDEPFTEEEAKEALEFKAFSKEMIALFNTMLPKFLLYTQERNQYVRNQKSKKENENQKDDEKSCSQTYGGEFLLRMLVHLPMYLSTLSSASSNLRPDPTVPGTKMLLQWRDLYQKEENSLGSKIRQLIVFLQTERKTCFKEMYRRPVSSEYTKGEEGFIGKSKK